MSPRTQLVFSGDLIAGFALDEARRNMAEHFKLTDQQIDHMFGGHEVVLKRHLDERDALRYVKVLADLGIHVKARPMPEAPATTTAALLSTSQMPLAAPLPTVPDWDPYQPDTIPVEPMVALHPAPAPGAKRPAYTPESSPSDTLPVTQPSPLTLSEGADDEDQSDVRCPTCGERQPMHVLCRNCATNLEMALKAQAEDALHAKAERLDASRARRGLPPAGRSRSGFGASGHASSTLKGTESGADDDAPPLWAWGWEGRLGRVNYATGMFALTCAMVLGEIITHRMPQAMGAVLYLALLIPVMVMSFRQSALRFHDRGHSGWWNLVVVAPVLLIVVLFLNPLVGAFMLGLAGLMIFAVFIYLLFFPGHDGSNTYGDPPREGSVPLLLASIGGFFVLSMMAPTQSRFGMPGVGDGVPRDLGKIALKSEGARRAFATEYLIAGKHKAFAASPDGSWGWKSEVGSADIAMSEALATCEKHRPTSQRPCELVSVNGKTVP